MTRPQKAGIVKITPSHLEILGQRFQNNAERCGVELFVIGGETLSPSMLQMWQRMHPSGRFINHYGPTEAIVGCIANDVTEMTGEMNTIPIGRPIANKHVYILDANGRPVPIGVTGELYIGGVGVARGYLNRPGLTAERFLPDPFVPATPEEPNPRMYKTGDLGRFLPDGNIALLGRNDFQVKIRGFRIELGEIEARLAEMDGVKEAAVLARQDSPGDKRLVAYYTGSQDLTVATLRRRLSRVLPEYMVPAAVVRLEALPLSPNGKLDRKALPAPEGDAFNTRAYEAPQGEVEQKLVEIWSELLNIEKIGRHDHFFELGGHSLLAVTLISRMQSEGLHVGVRTVFETPTIADLAAVIGKTAMPHEIEAMPNIFFKPSAQDSEKFYTIAGEI
jgi:acyl-CoA synthetase (AMP-forming)/AMP-acid ligase II